MPNRYLAFLVLFGLLAWAPNRAAAQLALPPPISLSGAAGVNASGYSASVPLEFPSARGGLPVPVQIVYADRGVGAAGRGWDLPLSYIRRDANIGGRRPVGAANVAPQAREQVTLSVEGRVFVLSRTASGWAARNDAPDIQVREPGDGTWIVYDGQGRTYRFTDLGGGLAGTNFWLLQDVSGADGAKLHLDYEVTTPIVAGATTLAFDLTRVSYNPHPTTAGCYKNSVALSYDALRDPPLSITSLGSWPVVRRHKLTFIDVFARAQCESAPVRIRRYQLDYQADADTQQPRLRSVSLLGQDGTPEASTPIVVAKYGYGSASLSASLMYAPVPVGDVSVLSALGHTSSPGSDPTLGAGFASDMMFIDVTGDGRPDRVSYAQSKLSYVASRSSLQQISFAGIQQLTDSTIPGLASLDNRTAQTKLDPTTHLAYSRVWREAIDVNGDGRTDIIDASEQAGRWIIYLNTPDPSDSERVRWVQRSISITTLAQQLASRGLGESSPFLPLTRHAIGRQGLGADGFGEGPMGTLTEWELRDINGDGYPDVVFNSSPAVAKQTFLVVSGNGLEAPPMGPATSGVQVAYSIAPSGGSSNKIEAVFGVLGTHLSGGANEPFSAPVTLRDQEPCGVEFWMPDFGALATSEHEECGIADVNGDGIADRVSGTSVWLGRGALGTNLFFMPRPLLTLPGPIAASTRNQLAACPTNTTYTTRQTATLRDFTGDGIPDYVVSSSAGMTVAAGTGAGFGTPLLVSNVSALSTTSNSCAGTNSTVTAGWLDVDGDSRLDYVINGGVFMLLGSDGIGAAGAGRLVSVDNGAGAVTQIQYRSIKGDSAAPHQVPFAEIVVASVETTGQQGLGGSLAATRYAYAGAELVFDPARDGFVFPGYRRTVMSQAPVGQPSGVATFMVTDAYAPVSPVDPYGIAAGANLDADQRYAFVQRIGRTRDITILSGFVGAEAAADPSLLLSTSVTADIRRIGAAHYEWTARRLTSTSDPAGPEPCIEAVFPYDHAGSTNFAAGHAHYDPCIARGFATAVSVQSWRGAPGAAPPSTRNVETRSEITRVDDLGRILSVRNSGDLHRDDDDLCTDTTYAEPTGSNERVLTAVASRTVTDCAGTIYRSERWEYDGLAAGSVSKAHVTSHTVERRSDTGTLLATIRQFDATYDASGNLQTYSRIRDDGATRTSSMTYDPFGLASVSVTTSATRVPTIRRTIDRDPLTLWIRGIIDPNGTQHGTAYDGFGRPVLSTVTPPGGTVGALSSIAYLGFAGGDSPGRRVVGTTFPDPIAPEAIGTATGRTTTTFLDELGRPRRTEIVLGADYPGVSLISQRTYDGLGRVVFEADPFPSTQNFETAYGTTSFFNADGTPSCSVRGNGRQATLPSATDEGHELYPNCIRRRYQDHTEVVDVQDASSLLAGSPQANVVSTSYVTAIGRVLTRSTWKGDNRLEHATFATDRLGRMTAMTRYQDPVAATRPVTTSWHFDSLDQLMELDEPNSSPRFYTYSDWGELVDASRYPDGIPPGLSSDTSTGRHLLTTYDALGRRIHSEERTDGVIDPEAVHDFFYDQGVAIAPQVTPAFTVGRLTQASSPTGAVSFSYDALGRVNARVFTDTAGGTYVEKRAYHGDGALQALDLFLPDTGFAAEHVDYAYDSAGRGNRVRYTGATGTKTLYSAGRIDPLGRVRQAHYGNVGYAASYADVGRRLLNRVNLSISGGRALTFPDYDPMGRERSRVEVKRTGTSDTATTITNTTSHTYDALGRLVSSAQTSVGGISFNQQFAYDPLGNLTRQWDESGTAGAATATLSYLDTDRDRICRISYGTDSGTGCNVLYDDVGAIAAQPTPTGTRRYRYGVDGQVRTIENEQATAHIRYDAFGELQEIEVINGGPPAILSTTHRIRYGELLELRLADNGSTQLRRKIPLPNGGVATLLSPSFPLWGFTVGESRGARFTFDELGVFNHDTDYSPFGTPSFSGLGSGFANNEQWNDGYYLSEFGISLLGARVYDPLIGRFTSRDPLLIPRTAATSNPYAFAHNDPINASDPTGLCEKWVDTTCPPYLNEDHGYYETLGGGLTAPGTFTGSGPSSAEHSSCCFGGSSPGGARPPVSPAAASVAVLGIGGLASASAAAPAASGGSFIGETVGAVLAGVDLALVGLVALPVLVGAGMYHSYKIDDHSIVCAEDPTICIELDLLAEKLDNEAAAKETAARERAAAIARADVTAEHWSRKGRPARTLYHYTDVKGFGGILESEKLNASLLANNPRDAKYGDGQYLTNIIPGTMRPGQLSYAFMLLPWFGRRYTHYVEIDVTGLNVVQILERPHIFLIPNARPLDLTGRIVSWGQVP